MAGWAANVPDCVLLQGELERSGTVSCTMTEKRVSRAVKYHQHRVDVGRRVSSQKLINA